MTDRRYHEDEVRKIFKLATTERIANAPASKPEGLTLAEIQSIGQEVGVEADVIARAAAALDTGALQRTRKTLGIPIEVERVVPLERALSDREWEQLVALMRGTFGAPGTVTTHGNLREWRNGNLFASHEPFGNGYRLRLGTRKGDAAGYTALGLAGLVASAATSVSHFLIFEPQALVAPIAFGVAGIAALASNWIRLPGWARRRKTQLEHIAATAAALVKTTEVADQSGT